ncbi:rhomboid family intramembrane serine protease [Thermodesulfovibrio thiophilus]|uniref:rhomboid family intramembrane serine protease n=1 Tax=Thermodesulfovibrio thiophilus TaxID=340095 RepID=UPI0017B3D448|nr:rhomboid family intramembrane serine protease [Thermodesulfovibrio thiophilus]HHW20651.1 rhomboid family intramembrane serine protease [Thermodesulfovibrio thiophilus]
MIPIRDCLPRRYTPYMTWIIIALNCIIFFFELMFSREDLNYIFHIFGIVPAKYMLIETLPLHPLYYLPFLTSMFLHGGWFHLISNMWIMWIFADNVEDKMGSFRFLIFYLLCGFGASWIHCLINPTSMMPTVGASGAISGVLGAYMVMFPHARVITLVPVFIFPLFFAFPAIFYILLWFFIQLFSGLGSLLTPADVGGVAWWAHVGGFLFGILLHRIFVIKKRLHIYDDHFDYYCAWRKFL